jgi:hypothetical protein
VRGGRKDNSDSNLTGTSGEKKELVERVPNFQDSLN